METDTRSPAGFRYPQAREEVQVFCDLNARWERSNADARHPEWLRTTWQAVQDSKLSGVMWYDASEIDAVVLDQGQIVGIAGTPWCRGGLIVDSPHAPETDVVMTAREAIEFYRQAASLKALVDTASS